MSTNTTDNVDINSLECFEVFASYILGNKNKTVINVFYALIIPFVIAVNVFLIVGIMKIKKGNLKASQKLFILLSSSDTSVGIVLLPMQAYLLNISHISCKQTALKAFWSVFPATLSGNTILLISLERYLHIAKFCWYRDNFSDVLLYSLIALEIIMSFLWSFWYTLVSLQNDWAKYSVMYICIAIYEAFILSSTLILNLKVLNYVKKNTIKSNVKESTEARLTKTISLIGGILIITYIPSVIGLPIVAYKKYNADDIDTLKRSANVLIWCMIPTVINSGLNALIYVLRNRDIKKEFGICQKKKQENAIQSPPLRASNDKLCDTNL